MSSSRIALALGLTLALSGCNQNRDSGLSYIFSRPEHLEFACFAPNLAPRQDEYETLPRECCETFDLSSEQAGALPAYCGRTPGRETLGIPRMHVFVTQSTRGEIAAVDLGAQRVLDSDRQVPGFTFIDSGGLPSALVVPRKQPRSTRDLGPVWTYVASAEENQVRAIPTCRFRSGQACGPDLDPKNADAPAYSMRSRVPLPRAPHDMVMGPDDALWVSLPEWGRLARIELAPTSDTEAVRDAFALDATTGDASEPEYFGIPLPSALRPPEPDADTAYVSTCGTGSPFVAAPRDLRKAPLAAYGTRVAPTRMRFDSLDANGSTGLLLVADRESPVLHAFTLRSDGSLTFLGALPTGAPVRDFVITPPVPPTARDLFTRPAAHEDPAAPGGKRYVYAIDDRDGSVMAFDYAPAGAGTLPKLRPLLAPAPGTTYADRISVPGNALTLDVIDTRSRSDYVCDEENIDGLRATAKRPSDLQARAAARVGIYDNADALFLRGVFVVVASLNGGLSVIDVHDLDTVCRADKACLPGGPLAKDPGALDAVAVRRHAVRRDTAGGLEATVADSSKLLSRRDECPSGYVPAPSSDDRACVPSDPWSTMSEIWSVQYQGTLPGSGIVGGTFFDNGDPTQLVLEAPPGLDLCERGVLPKDLVAITGRPLERLAKSASCPIPSASSAVELDILQATSSELVVQPHVSASLSPEAARDQRAQTVARLRECYPDQVGFELRAGSFLVRGTASSTNTYLHRVIAEEGTGACVVDVQKDARLTSRPVGIGDPDGDGIENGPFTFVNPYVAFTLRERQPGESEKVLDTTVTVRNAASPLTINLSESEAVTDALPTAVRYTPELGFLFVLDTASQGLRRYELGPFQRDNDFKPR